MVEKTTQQPEAFEAWKIIRVDLNTGPVVEVLLSPSNYYTGPFSLTKIKKGWMQAKHEPGNKSASQYYGFCVYKSKKEALEDIFVPEMDRVVKVLCKGTVHAGSTLEGRLAAYVEYIKFD
jgi:hypothetical protein